jgi:membrane fusion protein (multidrug efflux system)
MKHLLVLLVALVVAVSGCSACSKGEARNKSNKNSQRGEDKLAQASNSKENLINVKVAPLGTSTLTEYIVARGVTQALHEVTYSAEIPGKLEYLYADLGDRIRIGQLLARIDFQTLKAQTDQAQSQYELATATFERVKELRAEELISQQQFDEANSNMRATEAQLAIAKANLSKSQIRASRKGIVSAKYVEKAEYVGPGTRLYKVVDYRTVIVEAMLAETQVAGIRKDAAVEVQIDALGKSFQGKVDAIVPTADPASKTFELRVEIDNPDLEILVGMSAVVRVTAAVHNDVLVAPQSVVNESPNGRFVFVVEAGVAKKREVKLGAVEADKVVLLEGISQGESLVIQGQRDLIDGQKVRIVK